MTNHDLTTDDIDFVSALMIEAGQMAVSMRPLIEINSKESPEDKVTSADLAISTLLKNGIRSRFAGHCIVSEEDDSHRFDGTSAYTWLIDPIDGTQNYILGDGDYCVMVGLLKHGKPAFGWVMGPAAGGLYFGGPGYGAKKTSREEPTQPKVLASPDQLNIADNVRMVMGTRDRKANPWIMDLTSLQLLKTGSIGLKVAKILDGHADVFVHLSGKLKTWDTAGPAAIALGAGMDVGGLESDELLFTLPQIRHDCTVIMGRKGCLDWCREHLKQPHKQ